MQTVREYLDESFSTSDMEVRIILTPEQEKTVASKYHGRYDDFFELNYGIEPIKSVKFNGSMAHIMTIKKDELAKFRKEFKYTIKVNPNA